MATVKFFLAQRKDLDSILKRGARPADVFYEGETGNLFIVDREGVLVELKKVEEGLEISRLKIADVDKERELIDKEFPLLTEA